MRSTPRQAESDRYIEPERTRSTTENIVSLIGYAITQQINGDNEYAQRLIDQLISTFPERAQSIRLTAANMLTERITNGTAR